MNSEADKKYFFATEEHAFTIVKSKYSQHLQNITLVLLPQAMANMEYVLHISLSNNKLSN